MVENFYKYPSKSIPKILKIINWYTQKCHVFHGLFVIKNFAKCVKKKHLSEAFHTNFVFPSGNLSSLIR